MAQTVETYTGDGSTKLYTIPFPYIEQTDVKAKIDGSPTTAFTFANATQLEFTSAPANDAKILIFRQTDDSAVKNCLLYTSPSPRDVEESRMPSSA